MAICPRWRGLTETGNAYAITVTDTNVSASALTTLAGKTTGAVTASAVTSVTGSVSELSALYAATNITGLDDEAISITSGSGTNNLVTATDYNTVFALTSGSLSVSGGSDTTAPTVSSFTSTTADGSYGVGSAINITATMSEAVVAGSSFTVTLGTGASDEVVLTAASAGTTLSGTYTVSTGDSSADLNVSSFEVASGQSITDIYGNAMTSTSLPSGNNLADNSALVVDAAPPTSTITSVCVQCNHWCFDVYGFKF